MSAGPEHRLVAYGTLAPGRPNHHQLDGLDGRWVSGTVPGRLVEHGWGAALGYPALELDDAGPELTTAVFESRDLPDHWARLDDFEGPGYRRVVAEVLTSEGSLAASIYVVNPVL